MKKPAATLWRQRDFFFVADAGEISNLDLIRDMEGISKLIGIFKQVKAILMTAFLII
jgi:hypothetical protein